MYFLPPFPLDFLLSANVYEHAAKHLNCSRMGIPFNWPGNALGHRTALTLLQPSDQRLPWVLRCRTQQSLLSVAMIDVKDIHIDLR